jgi:hypothetical protein
MLRDMKSKSSKRKRRYWWSLVNSNGSDVFFEVQQDPITLNPHFVIVKGSRVYEFSANDSLSIN